MNPILKGLMFPLIIAVALVGAVMCWLIECLIVIPAIVKAVSTVMKDLYRDEISPTG